MLDFVCLFFNKKVYSINTFLKFFTWVHLINEKLFISEQKKVVLPKQVVFHN